MSWIDAYREQYEADKAQPDHPSEPAPGEPRPYSVLLVYPDYMTGGDLETYYTHVEARTVGAAIRAAQQECQNANIVGGTQESLLRSLDDLLVLLVIDGHPHDLKFQAEEEPTDAAV